MICPDMALTYADAKQIANRKGIWMVEYLRARRCRDRLIGYFRKKHFEKKYWDQA
ncbi:hypothetical protein RSK20926_11709 [Roseobacter sp. SK209-2-6]|uniref:hypothetical protein n=1 Tax=Roseobacter sp. SK209-2-6 TaxID=388739 RepID=UPI0000F3C679|nr:hypothetical protein [Roseobacter sp. SK209-2-6]EBA18383.1 hypothetical protein RSK20926_11709 [Roseobacter sp. SK209-2-6]